MTSEEIGKILDDLFDSGEPVIVHDYLVEGATIFYDDGEFEELDSDEFATLMCRTETGDFDSPELAMFGIVRIKLKINDELVGQIVGHYTDQILGSLK